MKPVPPESRAASTRNAFRYDRPLDGLAASLSVNGKFAQGYKPPKLFRAAGEKMALPTYNVPVTHYTYRQDMQTSPLTAAVQGSSVPTMKSAASIEAGSHGVGSFSNAQQHHLGYHSGITHNYQAISYNHSAQQSSVLPVWPLARRIPRDGTALQATAEIRKPVRKRRREIPERKGAWFPEEDRRLKALVSTYGPRQWREIARSIPGRTGKQARERWMNQLRPEVKKNMNWTPEEDDLILSMQARIGNQWSKIARHLPGRTDNHIKNRFNSTLKKRLEVSYGVQFPNMIQMHIGERMAYAPGPFQQSHAPSQDGHCVAALQNVQHSVPCHLPPIDSLRLENSTLTSLSSAEAPVSADSSRSCHENSKRISVRDLCC